MDLIEGQALAYGFEDALGSLQVSLGACDPRQTTVMPSPTMQGVLGIARTTGFSVPSRDSNRSVETPARIEISRVSRRSPASRRASRSDRRIGRLDANQDHIGVGYALMEIGFDRDIQFLARALASGGVLVSGPQPAGGEQAAGQNTADKRLAHDAGSQNSQRLSLGDDRI